MSARTDTRPGSRVPNARTALLLVTSLLLPLAVGALGGFATATSVTTWYAELQKPFFNPPPWVFGPVWTTLYLLMGVSLFLVWRLPRTPKRNRALGWFAAQLVLNCAWSFLFFGAERPDLALVDIVLLDAAVLGTIRTFRGLSRTGALLLVPYLLWILFATLLNGAIWQLN